ncbi:MAG: DUF2484 family protein [Pseudomonadota bacterium]
MDQDEGADVALMLAGLWALVATVIALLPRKTHWPGAYLLMAALVPVLVLLWREQGPLWAGLMLLGAMSVLRWPVWFALRWARRWM